MTRAISSNGAASPDMSRTCYVQGTSTTELYIAAVATRWFAPGRPRRSGARRSGETHSRGATGKRRGSHSQRRPCAQSPTARRRLVPGPCRTVSLEKERPRTVSSPGPWGRRWRARRRRPAAGAESRRVFQGRHYVARSAASSRKVSLQPTGFIRLYFYTRATRMDSFEIAIGPTIRSRTTAPSEWNQRVAAA